MFTEVVGKIRYGVIILFVKNMKTLAVVLTLVLSISFAPSVALAFGTEANAMCTPAYIAAYEMFAPCWDTNLLGFKTAEGGCVGVGTCEALTISNSYGKPPPICIGDHISYFFL